MGYARTRLEEATERVKELEVENSDLKRVIESFDSKACDDHFYEGVGGVYHARVLELRQERDDLQARLEAAERACAQMRDALQIAKDIIIYFGGENPERWLPVESAREWAKVNLALLAVAGTKSHADYETLQKENEQLKKACVEAGKLLERMSGLGAWTGDIPDMISRLSALVKEAP